MGIKSKRVSFTFDESALKTRPESDDDDLIVTHRALKGTSVTCLFCAAEVPRQPGSPDRRCHCPGAVRSRVRRADRLKAKGDA